MTQDPNHLTGRPAGQVDVLSEVLRSVRLTGALYYRVSTSTPWPAIRVPVGATLTSAFGGRTRNVASYHVLLEGSCWTGLDQDRPVRMRPGDVVVYPRGDPYFLACDVADGGAGGDEGVDELLGLLSGVSSGAVPPSFVFGDSPERTTFVCGFLGCGPEAFDPVLRGLPSMLHVSGAEPRLASLVELALAEAGGSPGEASVRERLSESMFIETVRQYVSGSEELGWAGPVADPVVGQALVLLHEDVAREWTLASLAEATGASRSVLADRFTRTVGRPPMQYLTQVRLALAGRLLREGTATVSAVAHQVGYGSEAAFSRAFKRSAGVSPARWRDGTATRASD